MDLRRKFGIFTFCLGLGALGWLGFTDTLGRVEGVIFQSVPVDIPDLNLPVTAWIQTSSATVDLKAAISSAMASAGVLHPRVFLGRLFIRFATSFSHVWLAPFRSVPLGMN